MPRIVVVGLGDSGLLTALHLARRRGLEVVGISTRPGHVSGQELGLRLARPEDWQRDYRWSFDRFKGLDRVRVVHAEATALDLAGHTLSLRQYDGSHTTEHWDVLVIATGVTNGFWRRPDLVDEASVEAALVEPHRQLADARDVLVVGGGAAAVSSALQLALRWPEHRVRLAFPGERALVQHHRRTWEHVERRLVAAGVELLPGHRAVVPDGFAGDAITSGVVAWTTGQDPTAAEAVLWTIGRVQPNTAWLPAELLDDDGFVAVRPGLQSTTADTVFAIGDVAATDPLRSSARNRADKLLARNIRRQLAGGALGSFNAPRRRWGSVLGVEPDGLRVFAPNGRPFRFPAWTVRRILQPWIVRRGIYRGVRGDTATQPNNR
ncbi:FAD-dependent oxidoreductase [Nocardioides caeni]|uniref:FAD-dependent oxidoreductase n=1 Tax=Nocardioides caeni TaxID=574700 RepID=UPI001930FCE1|nr:FAD-dependent oxidoreductase [Nocardioides caeni]